MRFRIHKFRSENESLLSLCLSGIESPTNHFFQSLETGRDSVVTISNILGDKSGFCCPCNRTHMTLLRWDNMTQFQLQGPKTSRTSTPEPLSFSLILHNRAHQDSVEELRQWRWATMNAELNSVDYPETDSGSLGIDAPPGGQTKTVRFQLFPKKEVTKQTKKKPEAPTVDLCLHISRTTDPFSRSSDSEIRLRADSWELNLKCPSADLKSKFSGPSLRSCEEVLGSYPGVMSTEQKLTLAFNVASTILLLYHTPWLNRQWTSHQIYLIRKEDGSTILDPLVTQTPASATEKLTLIDSTISALGRFLIEISCGAPWAYLCDLFCDPTNDIELRDFTTANTIFERANNEKVRPEDRPFFEEGPSYYEAVFNCISCKFDQESVSLDDSKFREEVYANIVAPLQFALEDFRNSQTLKTAEDMYYRSQDVSVEYPNFEESPQLFDDRTVQAGM
jgi:hypothetical protein